MQILCRLKLFDFEQLGREVLARDKWSWLKLQRFLNFGLLLTSLGYDSADYRLD